MQPECGGEISRLGMVMLELGECLLWVISRHSLRFVRCPALPPKADIGTQSRNVRFVPKADIDQLIRPGRRQWKYAWRNRERERPPTLKIITKISSAEKSAGGFSIRERHNRVSCFPRGLFGIAHQAVAPWRRPGGGCAAV